MSYSTEKGNAKEIIITFRLSHKNKEDMNLLEYLGCCKEGEKSRKIKKILYEHFKKKIEGEKSRKIKKILYEHFEKKIEKPDGKDRHKERSVQEVAASRKEKSRGVEEKSGDASGSRSLDDLIL